MMSNTSSRIRRGTMSALAAALVLLPACSILLEADATQCATTYAGGCASPIDLNDGGTAATFDFSSTFGAPKCIKVKSTQSLTLTGVSANHPLLQDCGPVQFVTTQTTTAVVHTYSTTGLYGFHCGFHGAADGTGMGLAVQVVQ